MIELMKKFMLTGLGLAVKTKDEIESIVNEMVKQGKMSEKEGELFLNELTAKYENQRKSLEQKIEKTVNDTLKRMNLATRKELEELQKEVAELRVLVGQK